MTLQARIDEIAAQEREWMAQGHPVAVVSNTVAWWNERGVYTAADLDAHFAGDPHTSAADQAYHDRLEWDAHCQCEGDPDTTGDRIELRSADDDGKMRFCAHYQEGGL